MAAAGLVGLFRSCMDSLKSLLTSREFGAEYELLCSELSLQSLRFRLWGNSAGIGLNLEENDDLPSSFFNRPDLQLTFDQAVSNIAYLLKEIEELRRKYQLKPTSLDGSRSNDGKSLRMSRSTLYLRSSFAFRQRIHKNQKEKSFVTIAKWGLCDARRFDEKVTRLKCLIDGLEDVTKAAGLSPIACDRSHSTVPEENPPPYSASEPLAQTYNRPSRMLDPPSRPEIPLPTYDSLQNASVSFWRYIPIMKGFLAACSGGPRNERHHARRKLVALSHHQLRELTEDVHDEIIRRQKYDENTPLYLSPDASLHPKRNEARKKLSTLHGLRFSDLVTHVVYEFERRFSNVQGRLVPSLDAAPWGTILPQQNRRWGVCPPNDAPPRLQYPAAHQSTNIDVESLAPTSRSSIPTSIFSPPRNFSRNRVPQPLQLSQPPAVGQDTQLGESSETKQDTVNSSASVEIFKSFRVSMEDPTYKVLPAALKKYNIDAPWENYALYIVYGDKERCLGMEEKPLITFKQLDKEGKKPMFMLRKVCSAPEAPLANSVSTPAPPGGIV